ncbi:hypothetical protein GOB94_14125 [Granulicella sp. 5B5]|uniref:SGNH/GDSL hydrolase family protein n=1 Tax=Granulicella sp. 5B5 TaxID=1617967 RepID=UPI0015F443D7|nr:SGNH/GDSL hydrolase family protein [Granulicella sp. 5B5]QMV19703.1 hypothetical protein GOB94_14125 [Granulicella sp. 5B5]
MNRYPRLLSAALALACLFCLGRAGLAQTTTITASNLKMAGAKITTGTVTFTPVNTLNIAISFADATGSQNGPTAFSCAIADGAITTMNQPDGTTSGTCAIPDATQTTPANILYTVQVCDTSTGRTTSGKCYTMQQIPQISGATWPLDHYGSPTSTSYYQGLVAASGASVPASCQSAAIFTRTTDSSMWSCVGGVYVQVGTTAVTRPYADSSANIATTEFVSDSLGFVPPRGSTVYYVDFGDSRVAGSALQAGDAPSDFIQSMSHFSGGKINVIKLGYPGETSCQIYANYAATAHAYAVNGTTRTVVYIHNAMGVNDILLGNTEASAFTCIQEVVSAEKADGMTVIQDTVYPVATAPIAQADGTFAYTPTWYPSSPDASCITPVQGWTAYGPLFDQVIGQLNSDIRFATYTTAPDYIIDWAARVTDMWDVQYTCEGVHTTAKLNRAWAQYVNNTFGIGTSIQAGESAVRRVAEFDSLYIGTRQVVDNLGGGNFGSVLFTSFPATGFPDHGSLEGFQSNTTYIDSIGNCPSGASCIGIFDLRQAVEGEGSNFDALKSDSAGNWTAYGGFTGSYFNTSGGRKGTFVCTAGGTITIANTKELATSDVIISLNAAGGTISTRPAMNSVTPGVGFSVLCGAADTSTYNYDILN